MNLPSKGEIKSHLKTLRKEFPRELVAERIGLSISMLNQCLSTRDMSDTMRYEIAKLTGMLNKATTLPQDDPDATISVKYSSSEFVEIDAAAKLIAVPFRDFIIRSSIARTREEILKS